MDTSKTTTETSSNDQKLEGSSTEEKDVTTRDEAKEQKSEESKSEESASEVKTSVDEVKSDEPEPEVIVENFEEKEKEPKTGFFADLNATPDSMSKWLGIVGGVLAVAFIAIFAIDMFMGKDDPSKSLDVSKKEAKITPVSQQKQQELPMPEVYGAKESDANSKKVPPIPTKSSATTAPTATPAPTSAPEPTATKAPDPTAAPTNTPEPTSAPTNTPEPSPTP